MTPTSTISDFTLSRSGFGNRPLPNYDNLS